MMALRANVSGRRQPQETHDDQPAEQERTVALIEPEQARGLLGRETQAGHFFVLGLNAAHRGVWLHRPFRESRGWHLTADSWT